MSDWYTTNGTINAVTPAPGDTALALIASTLTRARIQHILCGAYGTPVGDNILEVLVRRFTAVGTSTAVIPQANDPGAPAAQLTAGENFTVEPTYAATEKFDLPVHHRNTFQWYAPPRGEIIIPATANNGVGVTPIHGSYTGIAQAIITYEE